MLSVANIEHAWSRIRGWRYWSAIIVLATIAVAGEVMLCILSSNRLNHINIVGSVASVAGIILTVAVWIRAKAIAQELKDAEQRALLAIRRQNYGFLLHQCLEFLSDAHRYVLAHNWQGASIRTHDLGRATSSLAVLPPEENRSWLELSTTLNQWYARFESLERTGASDPDAEVCSWQQTYDSAQRRILAELGPFQLQRGDVDAVN